MIDFDALVTWLHGVLAEDEASVRNLNSVMPSEMDDRVMSRAWMLADIAAKRRLIGNCEAVINGSGWPGLAQMTLRLLASAYAARPGYRSEWAVR